MLNDLLRSALYLPASNARALEKARGLDCDMVIIDLEDSVKPEDKIAAREAVRAAIAVPWRQQLSVRINGLGTPWHAEDVRLLAGGRVPLIVVPKVEKASEAGAVAARVGAPVIAMIESPAGVYEAPAIARATGVAGLMAGTNDLATALRLPNYEDRRGLMLALQSIVMAARAAGIFALDGIYNLLEGNAAFVAQCEEGRALGFDGKSIIHPSQIEAANRIFGPTDAEIEDARALVDAATGGAERFRGRMVEAMHVDAARRLLALARG